MLVLHQNLLGLCPTAGGVKQASHLLKYDSTLGTFQADVEYAPVRMVHCCGMMAACITRCCVSAGVNASWQSGYKLGRLQDSG